MINRDSVYIAGMIVCAYAIYMIVGPGGDGVILASVVGALCAIGGVRYERARATIADQV